MVGNCSCNNRNSNRLSTFSNHIYSRDFELRSHSKRQECRLSVDLCRTINRTHKLSININVVRKNLNATVEVWRSPVYCYAWEIGAGNFHWLAWTSWNLSCDKTRVVRLGTITNNVNSYNRKFVLFAIRKTCKRMLIVWLSLGHNFDKTTHIGWVVPINSIIKNWRASVLAYR